MADRRGKILPRPLFRADGSGSRCSTPGAPNCFIELLPDFPLLLPAGASEEVRTYAESRAALKGATLLVARS